MNICGDETIHIPQTECEDCDQLWEELRKKQDKLTAGAGIIIEGDVISATGAFYTAGDGINIQNNVISAEMTPSNTYNKTEVDLLLRDKQEGLTAGQNISISGNTISATDTTYSAGTGLTLYGTTFNAERNPGNTYTKSEVDALIPTNVSDLTNDSGYQTQTQVEQLIVNELSNFDHLDYEVADSVPTPTTVVIEGQTVPTEEGVRYLVKHATDNRFEEYVLIRGVIYNIGSTGDSGPLVIPINPLPEPTAEGAIWFTT